MKNTRQAVVGFLASLLAVAILFGSLALALAESSLKVALVPAITSTPLPPAALNPTFTARPSETLPPPSATTQPSATATSYSSPTPIPPTSTLACIPPVGWAPVMVNPGDTLNSIAARFNTTPEALAAANCLSSMSVTPGMVLFVPPVQPTSQPTEPCGPPRGWVIYVVQHGDTLYSLAQELGVTIYQLQQANCMGSSTIIVTGQQIYVPQVPVRTLTPTAEPPLPTTPRSTQTSTATRAPSATVTQTQQPTATAVPTNTPVPTTTPTETLEPTNTDIPTETAVPTETSTPQSTTEPGQ